MQPSDLHYEKATPVPGWDKSLWPTQTGARLRLNARLESWRVLMRGLLAVLVALAIGLGCLAHAVVTLGWIALPPGWTPFAPVRDPYILLAGGVLIVPGMLLVLGFALQLIFTKAWQTLRALRPEPPDPDYSAIGFRSRRKR